MSNDVKLWHVEDGQPPNLVPLLGLRVYRAWLLPANKTIVLRLEGGRMVKAEGAHVDIPGQRSAIELTVAMEKDGADWSFLEALPQTPHLKDLRGRKLTGLDVDVLLFDGLYGVQLLPAGVRWVKRA